MLLKDHLRIFNEFFNLLLSYRHREWILAKWTKKFHPIIEYVDTSEVFGLPLITKTSMF